jgi:fibronectin-binding autotransporter adhesin
VQTRLNSTADVPGFEVHQSGFMAGVDHLAGHSTVGVAAGYSHADIGEQETGNTGTTDTLRMALYGSRWLGRVQVSATLGYGLDFLSQSRLFEHAGTATGDHIGQEVTAAAQASLPIAVGGVTITPRLGMRYAYFHGDGFDEQGADRHDLSVGTDNVRSLQPYVEATFDKTFGSDLAPVNVQFALGYAQELLDTNRTMTVGLQNGPSFEAAGVALPRGELTTGLSVSIQASKATTILLSYDALINTGHASSQAADVRLDYRF